MLSSSKWLPVIHIKLDVLGLAAVCVNLRVHFTTSNGSLAIGIRMCEKPERKVNTNPGVPVELLKAQIHRTNHWTHFLMSELKRYATPYSFTCK